MKDGNAPVITGIGLISALGIGKNTNWQSMVKGKSGIRPITRFDTSNMMTKIAGELPGCFEDVANAKLRPITRKRTAHFTQLALVGAMEALEDSGLDFHREDRERVGVILGNCMGGMEYLETLFRSFARQHIGRNVEEEALTNAVWQGMESLAGLKFMQNAMTAQIAIDHGIYGPNMVISTACAAGGMAVEIAADYIRRGTLDIVITGGAEIFVTGAGQMSFSKLTALSIRNDDPQRAIKPFDKNRDGTILGDGAGILILESQGHASKRGVPIYAKVRGCASNCEGYSLAIPEPSGEKMAAVMKMALKNAQVAPDQIDYLSAHGTATPQNDRAEAAAVHLVFKEHAKKLPVSSQKSMIGHTVGAAGAIELAVTAMSLCKGIITPNINYETPDPACDLNIVANEAQEREMRFAASNSFALGGHNSCIILEKA